MIASTAVVLEFFREVDYVVPGHFRPAVDRDLAILGVERNHHVAGERGACIVQEARCLDRGGADDHETDAAVDIALDGIEIADAPAQLHWNAVADGGEDRLDRGFVLRFARGRAVQIDHVQPARTLLHPLRSHGARVFGENGGILHDALLQAYALAVLQIDRRDYQHAA